MALVRCPTHYPRHVVVNLLPIKLWSQSQASSITIMTMMTFNSISPMLHHQIVVNNHLSSAIIEYCSYPLLQFINSIICVFITLYKFKINILLVFESCLIHQKNIILLWNTMWMVKKKLYNIMHCENIFVMEGNIGDNELHNSRLLSLQCTTLLGENNIYTRLLKN